MAVDSEPCVEGLLRSNARFRRLWGAQTVSVFGDAITGVAVPTVAVLSLHASALAVGVWVDRLPRRPVLVGADLIRLALVGAPAALVCDVVSFVVSALLLGTGEPLRRRGEARGRQPFVAEIREGITALLHYHPVFRGTFAACISNFAFAVGQGVFFIYAYRTVDLKPAVVGIALTLGSIGNVAGAAIAPRLSRRLGTGPSLVLLDARRRQRDPPRSARHHRCTRPLHRRCIGGSSVLPILSRRILELRV